MLAKHLKIGERFCFPGSRTKFTVRDGELYCEKTDNPGPHVLMRVCGDEDQMRRLPYVVLEPAEAAGHVSYMGWLSEVHLLEAKQ